MQLTRLDSSFRKNLKDLLLGYVEQCEVCDHLVSRIEFPIYYHGFKFGAPVFTHNREAVPSGAQEVIGVVGLNTPASQLPADIAVHLLERVSQDPDFSGSAVLRMLPIANPVALELEEHSPATDDWPVLGHLVERFRQEATGGLIEIVTGERYEISGNAPASVLPGIANIAAEPNGEGPGPEVRVVPTPASGRRWQLRISVPASWQSPAEIDRVASVIARLVGALVQSAVS